MPVFRFVAMSIAKTLSKVFGLATMTFFGRMPSRDDDRIALIGIVSLTWLPIALAIFVPQWAEIVVPFAPDDDELTRLIAIAGTVLIPLVVGIAVATMHNHEREGLRRLRFLVLGYYYTLVVGLTVTAIVLVVPVVKASYLVRRFTVLRIMVMIPEGGFAGVRDHLVHCLRQRGVEVEQTDPNMAIRWLFRVLARMLGRIFGRQVSDDLAVLRGRDPDGDWFEITVHSADITIVGRERVACWLHAVLVDDLDERLLYLTWDDDAQRLERELREHRDRIDAGQRVDPARLGELVDELARLELDREEWHAVRRVLYRLERDAERIRADGTSQQPAGSAPA